MKMVACFIILSDKNGCLMREKRVVWVWIDDVIGWEWLFDAQKELWSEGFQSIKFDNSGCCFPNRESFFLFFVFGRSSVSFIVCVCTQWISLYLLDDYLLVTIFVKISNYYTPIWSGVCQSFICDAINSYRVFSFFSLLPFFTVFCFLKKLLECINAK